MLLKLLLFAKSCNLLWQILYGFGQMFRVANGQILYQETSHLITLNPDMLQQKRLI